jgi:conjugal transfer/entry exclusion protein
MGGTSIPVTIKGSDTLSSASSSQNSVGTTPAEAQTPSSGKSQGSSAGDSASSSSSGSGASVAVQTLVKLIARLQKQLAQQEQELHKAMAHSNANDVASMAIVHALQSSVATISSELASAVNKLAAVTEAEGSSSGALVSTSA